MRAPIVLSLLSLLLLSTASRVVHYPRPPLEFSTDAGGDQRGWLVQISALVPEHDIDALREFIADSNTQSPPYDPMAYYVANAYFGRNRTYLRVAGDSLSAVEVVAVVKDTLQLETYQIEVEPLLTFGLVAPTNGVQTTNVDHGLDRLDQRSGGRLDGRYAYRSTAAAVYVFILDTGVSLGHSEFLPSGRALAVGNYVGDGVDGDCHGHGTHVASLAGGKKYGTAKAVKIRSKKVLGCDGKGTTDGIVYAILDIADTCGEDDDVVINLSLGAQGTSSMLTNAISQLHAQCSAIVVAAGGNAAANACGFVPVSIAAVVGVGSSFTSLDGRDHRSDFSNYGSCIDMFAPGENIMGADSVAANLGRRMTGTSMATPFVSGVAAIALDLIHSDGNNTHLSPKDRATMARNLLLSSTSGSVTQPFSDSRGVLYAGLVAGAATASLSPLLAVTLLSFLLFFV